ncbi:hypothetical protein [Streptomyces sp. NPDC059957]|uniref:hypothetical protein n=1 Tax=unclassified Streptomyces TaxID=2593676 RepID=UPI0036632777
MTEAAEFLTRPRADIHERDHKRRQKRDRNHGQSREGRDAAFRADQRRWHAGRLAVGAAAALVLAGVTAWLVTAPDERTAGEPGSSCSAPCPAPPG